MDLAALYCIEPKVLVQAVKRNRERFPYDFMFQLTKEENSFLRSQIVTHKELAKKFDEMEKKYDAQFRVVFDAIRQLYPVRGYILCTILM